MQDLKSYKIPNQLIVIGYFISFLFYIKEYGGTSIYIWIGSIVIPILILFPIFIIKALGAGDIKLFSVIGGFFGITYAIKSMAAAFVVAAILSVMHMIRHKNFSYRIYYLITYIREFQLSKSVNNKNLHNEKRQNERILCKKKKFDYSYYNKERDGFKGVIHFSLAILAAVLLEVIFSYFS